MTSSDDRLYPADWQQGVRFSGIYSFMALPVSRDLSRTDVAIVGVPFDTGVNHRPGARFGPRGIRQGTAQIRPHGGPDALWGPFRSMRVIDYGDLNIPPQYIDSVHDLSELAESLQPRPQRPRPPHFQFGDEQTLGQVIGSVLQLS